MAELKSVCSLSRSASSQASGRASVLSAPAGSRTSPAFSLRIFLYVLESLPRLLLWCTYPFLPTEQRPFRRCEPVSGGQYSHGNFCVGDFQGCNYSFIFRPVDLLATQIAPAAVSQVLRPCQSHGCHGRPTSHLARFSSSDLSGNRSISVNGPMTSRFFHLGSHIIVRNRAPWGDVVSSIAKGMPGGCLSNLLPAVRRRWKIQTNPEIFRIHPPFAHASVPQPHGIVRRPHQ